MFTLRTFRVYCQNGVVIHIWLAIIPAYLQFVSSDAGEIVLEPIRDGKVVVGKLVELLEGNEVGFALLVPELPGEVGLARLAEGGLPELDFHYRRAKFIIALVVLLTGMRF